MKKIVEALRDNPKLMFRIQTANLILWMTMTALSTITGWIYSSAYISEVSNIALILAAGSWMESAAVRVKQGEEAKKDVAQDVVEKVVEKTEVEPENKEH